MLKTVTSLALFTSELVMADQAVFCASNADLSRTVYGDLSRYQSCDGRCACSVFELQCFKSTDGVRALMSESYEYSQSCDPRECLCNTADDWLTVAQLASPD